MTDQEPIKIETGSMAPLGSPVRVGKRLPGVNIGQARDMLLGKDVPEEVAQTAAKGSESNHPDLAGHIPTIGALTTVPDGWGVFCLRCSADSGQYIYPCKINPEDWPPEVLVPYVQVGGTGAEVTPE